MSGALAIPAVTAVLQFLLNIVYNDPASVLGGVLVSAVAPDLVRIGPDNSQLQVNLFLHQVTPNIGWRNIGLPSLGPDGTTRLQNQPMALDLHYLLTAYAVDDSQAEALLGTGVFLLHQNPVLPRNQIRAALTPGALPPTYSVNYTAALLASGLADQIEMIKITPATLGREEMAWLWTALKADYRPTFPFQATVVLVEPQNPLTEALPVLQRVVAAQPNLRSPLPTITEADPPKQQPAAVLGDVVTVLGYSLANVNAVLLINSLREVQRTIAVPPHPSDTSFQFTVPPPQPNPTDIPVGVYLLSAQAPAPPDTLRSNNIAFAIAPKIGAGWPPGPIGSGSAVTVTVPCAPFIRPGQQAALLIGSQEAPMDTIAAPTNTPSFTFATLQPTGGPVPARLQVDGIDSPCIDMTQIPPVFSGPFVQVT
jgi:Pvc16 N-terminal domain